MIIKKPALQVLIVDDTVLYRKVLSEIFKEMSEVEVMGTASNGKIALSKIEQMRPDLITLDFEMPEMDGLEVLRELRSRKNEIPVVMVSSHTREGAEITVKALELGAFSFVAKPQGKNPLESRESLENQLLPIIKALAAQFKMTSVAAGVRQTPKVPETASAPPAKDVADMILMPKVFPPPGRVEVVAIGISTGGPNALAEVVPRLPADLRVPVLIVQHMPPMFTQALADSLNQKSRLQVVEARHEMIVSKGTVYLAPGGKQMKVVSKNGQRVLEINSDPPENHCQPSVDYLFRSLSQIYENRALAVIMTGMGADGTLGLKLMKRRGAQVIAQNKETCVVFGMPAEAIAAGVTDVVVPLGEIAETIVKYVNR